MQLLGETSYIFLLRFVNTVVQHENIADMWKEIIDKSYYITQFEEEQYRDSCDKTYSMFTDYYIRQSINKALEEKLHINASYEIFDNITEEVLKSSAEMFIYLNHCYNDHHGGEPIWLSFYYDLFMNYNPTQILLVINRLRNTKQGKIAEQSLNLLQNTWNLTFSDDAVINDKDFAVMR